IGAQQVLIGMGLGLVLRLVFLVLEFAGQIIAQQMGLGFAAMVDPASGAQVPVISQFYVILATLTFFALDAHLQLVTLLADSFELLPIGGRGVAPGALAGVIAWSGDLLGLGVVVMLPIVASLLVVNLAFGVMARAAPQLNVFAVGFPVMIVFGTLMMVLTLGALPTQVETLFATGFDAAYRLLQGP
ncbi:MAG: flagellar biosynthetic protein FliR, partial [Gammaproteobacteria bacterium]|nr:flagellar biosynthetic protein FliR [Gammaproteobacteria bacterium]